MIIGTVNQADSATLSGGDWQLPLSRMQEQRTGKVARSARTTPSSTCFKVTRGGNLRRLDALALVNHSMRTNTQNPTTGEVTGVARWRVRWVYGGGSPAVITGRAKPLVIQASTNLTGAVTALQDPDPEAPTATWLTATSPTANTDLRVTFDSSDAFLQTGAGLQQFRALVRRTGSGGSNPTVILELWYAGVFKATVLASTAVSSTTGTLLTVTWDAALLPANPLPALVELRVRGTASATATVEVGAAEFNVELVQAPGVQYRDSGWMTVSLPWNTPEFERANLYLVYLGGGLSWDEIWVDLDDTGSEAGFVDLGRLAIVSDVGLQRVNGTSAQPALNIRPFVVDSSQVSTGRNGTRFGDQGMVRKGIALSLANVAEASALTGYLGQIVEQVGLTREFLFIADETRTDHLETRLTIWGGFPPDNQPGGPAYNGVSWDTPELVVQELS